MMMSAMTPKAVAAALIASKVRSAFVAPAVSSTNNDAVTWERMFSAMRRFPADEPFKQPPGNDTFIYVFVEVEFARNKE